uniref:Helicase C-terminal domain-containing protein n=1 Tax=viral metagenome TaxID=1070528 RepID=A0A6C0EZA3_9ZZZZ
MADQEYQKIESQIKDFKKRLLESKDDPQQQREIEGSLRRLESIAQSYSQRSSASVSSSAAVASSRAVVNDPYIQSEQEGEGEGEESENVAESSARLVSEKAKLERTELSERARENLLQMSQAPDVGPHILPSGKPGVNYAQQTMIHALQTKLAPAFILERLEAKPTPATQSNPNPAKDVDPLKPKPQARQKIKITFPTHRDTQPGMGEGEGALASIPKPHVDIVDKRAENILVRSDILERLRGVLHVHVAKASEITQSERSKLSPKMGSMLSGLVSVSAAAAEADTSLLMRQIIIIRKLPRHIHLVEDVSLFMSADKALAVKEPATMGVGVGVGALAPSSSKRVTEKPIWGLISEEIERMEIKGEIVVNRLPRRPLPSVSASHYYMTNRQKFVNFINELFLTYHDEIVSQKEQISCDPAANAEFSLLTHQKIVREYLNIYTPYRGLLLYHGLGSGKTCSSIAIAEGLKTYKNVIVMTPASLRRNYIEEMKKCGDDIYKKNQFWEFIPITNKADPMIQTLAAILQLKEKFIIEKRGAWLVNVKKPSNYVGLNADEKESLDHQIEQMIDAKYTFLNYNGMRMSHLKTLSSDFTQNPFSNHVVIIDEAHNFISRIVNKLKRPTSMSMRLYDMLMTAENVKIILLTGTPVINYPNEIAIIFNILRGYIKTWKIPLQIASQSKIDKKALTKIFEGLNTLDYMDYNDSSHVLTVTRNPFGFLNVDDKGQYNGVLRVSPEGETPNMTDTDFERLILGILKGRDINVSPGSITIETFKALPDSLDAFRSYFINSETGQVKNINMFQRRILGLTSYFRSAQEQLMPKYDKDMDFRVVEVPMSDHQFVAYEQARAAERKLEKKAKSKKRPGAKASGAAGAAGAGAGGGDDIYEDAVSTYRIFSRLFCNFVFPTEIGRPLPKEDEDVEGAIREGANEEDVDAIKVSERLENPNGEHTTDEIEELAQEITKKVDTTYDKRIIASLARLKSGMMKFLTKPPQGELHIYSPKFLAMLENIQEPQHQGLNLVYSQFRTLEGIGIFSLVLEANGFARFKIRKNDSGNWVCDINEADQGKPMFALYTGTESDEEREIIRNVFNSTWDYIPVSIKEQLVPKSSNNFMGEIIKVLMITASGAEGISLRNVRYVHIMEPYWHPVRIEQVIGRARRICSHNDLKDEKLRTVSVMLYVMSFTPKQMSEDSSLELRLNDVSKRDSKKPITTDQSLFEISTIKEEINRQLLMAVKESSIDCSIHRNVASKEKLKCFTFGVVNSNKFSFAPSIDSEESDASMAQNTKETELKLVKITLTIGGVKGDYAFDKKTSIVYDYSSYLAAREMGGEPLVVGKIVEKEGAKSFVKMSAAMATSSAHVASTPAAAAASAKPKKSDKPSLSVGEEESKSKKEVGASAAAEAKAPTAPVAPVATKASKISIKVSSAPPLNLK